LKVVILGASGFLGSEVLRRLGTTGFSKSVAVTRCVPKPTQSGKSAGVIHCTPGELINDVRFIQDTDLIINCAGSVPRIFDPFTPNSTSRSDEFLALLKDVVRTAIKARVRKFVNVSSAYVYSSAGFGSSQITLMTEPNPDTPYGRHKLLCESVIDQACEHSDMEVFHLRLPVVYGPGMRGGLGFLLKLVKWNIPAPTTLESGVRSFLGIRNAVDGIVEFSLSNANNRRVTLLCDEENLTLRDFLSHAAQIFERNLLTIELPEYVGSSSYFRFMGSLYKKLAKGPCFENITNPLGGNWRPPHTVKEELELWAGTYV
jgi:nucleoside-diphosphate-sugar epimerase